MPGGECVLIKGRFDWQKYCDLSDGHFLAQYLCVAQISVSLPGLNAERLVLVSTTASIKSLNSSVRCPNPSCLASHPLSCFAIFSSDKELRPGRSRVDSAASANLEI